MRWELEKVVEIDAAHRLDGYDGKCANLHGHRWKVIVVIEGSGLDSIGMMIDFGIIKEVVNKYDHKVLNDAIRPGVNPTAENLAMLFWDEVQQKINDEGMGGIVAVKRITVYETPDSKVTFYG